MRDAMDWVRGHIAIVVGAVAVVVVVAAVAVMAALGVFASKAEMPKIMPSEEATVDVSLSVTADAGWTVDSTPAVVHVKGADEDTSEVDFYHAVAADEEGNKGSSKVTITEGSYTVAFLAPVNADGSTFNIDAAMATQSIEVDADADAPTVACAMAQIPADQVGDDVLQAAIANLRAAVDLGDATLKGNAGRDILAKMEANIANNPNVSEETKVEAERVEEEADVDSSPVSTVVTRPYTPSQGGATRLPARERATRAADKAEPGTAARVTKAAPRIPPSIPVRAAARSSIPIRAAVTREAPRAAAPRIPPSIPVRAAARSSIPIRAAVTREAPRAAAIRAARASLRRPPSIPARVIPKPAATWT